MPGKADGVSIDVVDDLVGYTGLEREQVLALIQRRHENFRTEWHGFPPQVRTEAWFYLASRTYLFGNAAHDAEPTVDALAHLRPAPSDILDFGGGTGNLALALVARGNRVDYLERSALQKDFVRFRIQKYGFDRHICLLDQWIPLESSSYDIVCAMDVLEHVENLAEALAPISEQSALAASLWRIRRSSATLRTRCTMKMRPFSSTSCIKRVSIARMRLRPFEPGRASRKVATE